MLTRILQENVFFSMKVNKSQKCCNLFNMATSGEYFVANGLIRELSLHFVDIALPLTLVLRWKDRRGKRSLGEIQNENCPKEERNFFHNVNVGIKVTNDLSGHPSEKSHNNLYIVVKL